jgi:16S rRNA (cytosine967-C5)-methyltransferase
VTVALKEIFVDGFHADKVLERLFKSHKKWGSRDRRFVAETVYNITRWWSLLLFWSQIDSTKTFSENDFLLIWTIYERWHNEDDVTGFVNHSFLAGFQPEKIKNKISQTSSDAAVRAAFPRWIFDRFEKAYGRDSLSILNSLNDPAPVCLRANTLKTNTKDLQERLRTESIETRTSENKLSPECLLLNIRQNVFVTKAFREGNFEVQDEASQKVAPLLDPKPGERIADMCAGAGGKTLHLAALMKNKGSLVAGDVIPKKLEQLKERARRAGVSNLRIVLLDDTKFVKRHKGDFDGVLIDAPCSGLGVVRRNPDTKWKASEEELTRLKALQATLLTNYSKLVKPGGRLVYATCSMLPEENQEQINKFLESNTDFTLGGEPLLTRPDRNEGDGFFAQRLNRK